MCQRKARHVHHKSYTRAVLMGYDLRKLVALCARCHHNAEFDEDGAKRHIDDVNRFLAQKRCDACYSLVEKLNKHGVCGPCQKKWRLLHTKKKAAKHRTAQCAAPEDEIERVFGKLGKPTTREMLLAAEISRLRAVMKTYARPVVDRRVLCPQCEVEHSPLIPCS
jgi:hypothetical protein